MTPLPHRRERSFQVSDQVVDVLDAHRQANQTIIKDKRGTAVNA